jgi:hypothetical protein
MLEEFGLTEKPEGGYDINLQRSVNGVVNELSNYFGFKRHDGIVEFTAPGSEAANLRRILNSRNANQNAIENAVDRISAGAEVYGLCKQCYPNNQFSFYDGRGVYAR